MAKFPEPPAALSIPPAITVLPAGATLFRVLYAGGAHPAAWNGFRYFGPTTSRFDHHDDPPRVQPRGILYAARSPVTCLAEVFQATRVIDRVSRAPHLVGFSLMRDVRLLDLTGAWPTRAGASMAINSGPRPRARRWSRCVYASYAEVEGIAYASSMHANTPCFALYERAQSALPASPVVSRPLSDGALLSRLGRAATELGYLLV